MRACEAQHVADLDQGWYLASTLLAEGINYAAAAPEPFQSDSLDAAKEMAANAIVSGLASRVIWTNYQGYGHSWWIHGVRGSSRHGEGLWSFQEPARQQRHPQLPSRALSGERCDHERLLADQG